MKPLIVSILLALCLAALLSGGCLAPPKGTMWLDTSGDGQPDLLVEDLDDDGQADLGPDGRPIPAVDEATMAKLRLGLQADKYGPQALGLIGSLIGVPVLVAVGAVWKSVKFGKVFANTVVAVQAARKALAKSKIEGALEIVDAALDKKQWEATREAVAKVKDKLGIGSVSDPE